MNDSVVLTLCNKSTGQILELKHNSTLDIGRSSFNGIASNHISRKQGKKIDRL
jgi:hypothetical protein